MRLHVRDVGHLEELIDRFTPYGQTTTSIVQSSPVPGRGVPLPAPARLRVDGAAGLPG
jgi:Lrp/AsnC family leucine-responsive transcriptional regulator